MYKTRPITIGFFTLLLGSCSSNPVVQDELETLALATHEHDIAYDVDECRHHLSEEDKIEITELDPSNINLLSWNIKKGQINLWQDDLLHFSEGKNLVLIQEAVLGPELTESFSKAWHWSFGKGYQTPKQVTGVMTLSNSEPLTHCNLKNIEPWLGTAKATTVTEYGLLGIDNTLAVVNIHAINFSFGVKEFKQQMDQVREVLAVHDGPVILSGDFNTWSKRRLDIIESLAFDLDLEAMSFQEDHRKTAFGFYLDHLYVRDLKVINTETHHLKTSDHNPIIAQFSI